MKYDIVLYTPCLSSGVDFNYEHFNTFIGI